MPNRISMRSWPFSVKANKHLNMTAATVGALKWTQGFLHCWSFLNLGEILLVYYVSKIYVEAVLLNSFSSSFLFFFKRIQWKKRKMIRENFSHLEKQKAHLAAGNEWKSTWRKRTKQKDIFFCSQAFSWSFFFLVTSF